MSFFDRLMLWFHVAFVIFTIGPVTLAISSTPRAIRTGNTAVLRYLLWMTRIFGAATLGVFAFGMVLGQSLQDLEEVWLIVSMTLFVVALLLLLLIMRDQRRALTAMEAAARVAVEPGGATAGPGTPAGPPTAGATTGAGAQPQAGEGGAETTPAPAATPAAELTTAQLATVERGRIASLGGVVSLLWLAILVLMIWRPG